MKPSSWIARSFAILLAMSVLAASTSAEVVRFNSEGMRIQASPIASGFGVPWGITFLNDNELLVSDRQGVMLVYNLKTQQQWPLKNLPKIHARGQGGLLDVAYHSPSETLFFTYTKPKRKHGVTTLARAKISGDTLTELQDVLVTQSVSNTTRHYGSRIAFKDDYVFFTVGDRGERESAQELESHNGTVIRLHLDGSIPKDNPFQMSTVKALPEIWSFGHRNPQGLYYDKLANRLWSIEHGPRGGDEINLIEAGKNYGWPTISYGKEYWGPLAVGESTHKAGMEQPIKHFTPSIAPSSLIVYRGEAFPKWRGNLLSGALKLQHINRVTLNPEGTFQSEERLLEDLGERIRSLASDAQGWIYFGTDSGDLWVMKPQ